ncbi:MULTISPECIES: hypothetical protein [unclassified Streptomyces]|uniref:hypothetical protein n=1 Tax=unclassified Streptomyces TaxID=2593676 RepID=UPI0033BE5001
MSPYAPTLPAAPGAALPAVPGTALPIVLGAVPARAANRRPGAAPRTITVRAAVPGTTVSRGTAVRAATVRTTVFRAAGGRAATPGAVPASLTTAVARGPGPTGPTTTNRSEAA